MSECEVTCFLNVNVENTRSLTWSDGPVGNATSLALSHNRVL